MKDVLRYCLTITSIYTVVAKRQTHQAQRYQVQYNEELEGQIANQDSDASDVTSQANDTLEVVTCPALTYYDEQREVCRYDIPNHRPLFMEPGSGSFRLKLMFDADLKDVAADKGLVKEILSDLEDLDQQKELSNGKAFKNWRTEAGRNLENVEFLSFGFEEVVVHAVLHAIIHGGAGYVAKMGLDKGMLYLLLPFQFFLSPAWITYSVGKFVWDFHRHYVHKAHATEAFAKKMVFSSLCVNKKRQNFIEAPTSPNATAKHAAGNPFKKIVSSACSFRAQKRLKSILAEADKAMHELFETIASIGRCVYPHGPRRWAKQNCVESISSPLHQWKGAPGLLYQALAYAATYGRGVDMLLKKPIYKDLIESTFGLEKLNLGGEPQQHEEDTEKHSATKRKTLCLSIVMTQKAAMKMIRRFTTGLKVWMQTYARGFRTLSARTHWHPCKKVFNAAVHHSDKNGFCKSFDFNGKDKHALDEHDPCHAAEHHDGHGSAHGHDDGHGSAHGHDDGHGSAALWPKPEPKKPGLLSKINPFKKKKKTEETEEAFHDGKETPSWLQFQRRKWRSTRAERRTSARRTGKGRHTDGADKLTSGNKQKVVVFSDHPEPVEKTHKKPAGRKGQHHHKKKGEHAAATKIQAMARGHSARRKPEEKDAEAATSESKSDSEKKLSSRESKSDSEKKLSSRESKSDSEKKLSSRGSRESTSDSEKKNGGHSSRQSGKRSSRGSDKRSSEKQGERKGTADWLEAIVSATEES